MKVFNSKIINAATILSMLALLSFGFLLLDPLELQAETSVGDKPEAVPSSYNYEQMETAIADWTRQLAEEEGFTAWKDMTHWTISPLGPGTHGWVVILHQDEQEIGHLIVHASPDGLLHLTEYGTGEHPLFSEKTLYQSLVQQELIPIHISFEQFEEWVMPQATPVYMHPLEAYWNVQLDGSSFVIDAKSGEWYSEITHDHYKSSRTPINFNSVLPMNPGTEQLNQVIDQTQVEPFDVYMRLPWLTTPPLQSLSADQFIQKLNNPQIAIAYTASILEEQVFLPFSVIGLSTWITVDTIEDDAMSLTYIQLDQMGSRFIPLDTLSKQGHFYESKRSDAEFW